MHSILKRLHLAASLQQCSKPLEKRYGKMCTINLKIVGALHRTQRDTNGAKSIDDNDGYEVLFMASNILSGRAEYRSSFWTDFGRMPSTTFQLFFDLKDFLLPSPRLLLLRSKNELLRGAKYNVMCNTLTTMCVYIKEREKELQLRKGHLFSSSTGIFPFFLLLLCVTSLPSWKCLYFLPPPPTAFISTPTPPAFLDDESNITFFLAIC